MSGTTERSESWPGASAEASSGEEEREDESQPASIPAGLSAGPIRHMQDVFSNWWRRAILYCLTEESSTSLTDLTRRLIARAWESASGPRSLKTTGLIKHTRHRLRHSHVLELDDFGLVAFDSDSGTVRLAEDASVSVPAPWE